MLLAITQPAMSPEGRTGIIQGKWWLMRECERIVDSSPLGHGVEHPETLGLPPFLLMCSCNSQRQSNFPRITAHAASKAAASHLAHWDVTSSQVLQLFDPLLSSQKYCYSARSFQRACPLYPNSPLFHQSRTNFYDFLFKYMKNHTMRMDLTVICYKFWIFFLWTFNLL